MSVTTRTAHIISCDRTKCQRAVRSAYNLATAQAAAVRQGWQVSYHPDWDGGIDLCPEHKTTEGSQHGDDESDGVRAAL